MKNTIATVLFGICLASTAPAATILSSPYGGQNPGGVVDTLGVLGKLSQFDIDSVAFTNITGSNVTVRIDFNYDNGDTTLSPFNVGGFILNPGDLLMTSGSQMWGVALANHSGFSAGNLYSADAFLTASTVLGNPQGVTYRPTNDVWMSNDGHQHLLGAGTSTSTNMGFNEVQTTLSFAPTAALFSALSSSNGLNVEFAIATCANDYVSGTIAASSAPEPGAFVLLGSGLIGLSFLSRLRKKAQPVKA